MKAYIYLAMLPLAVSCIGANKMQEEFVETSPEECLVIDGKTIFTFEPDKCQESYSPEKNEFRIGDDSMSNYYAFKAESALGATGSTVMGDLSWTTDVDVRYKLGMEYKIVKSKGELRWLWCRRTRTGLVVRVIE